MSNTIISLRRLVGTAVVLSALAMPAAEAPAAAPPPVNDAFAAASTLAGDSGKVASRTVGASKEPAEPNHAGNPGGRSVWFAWTAPADGQYRFETIGDLDTLLAVYIGDAVDVLTLVAESDDRLPPRETRSVVSFRATAGTVYRVAVDGFGGKSGWFDLAWTEGPPNDNFADAQPLDGRFGDVDATLVGATMEEFEFTEYVPTVWFRWTAPETSPVSFSTRDSGLDTYLAVYTGEDPYDLDQIARNDDDEFAGCCLSRLLVKAVEGTTYWIQISPWWYDEGAVSLRWRPAVLGTSRADVISGSADSEEIRGLAGNDVIHGGGGDDEIFPGAGSDRAFGEGGRDLILDRRGLDRLFGGPGGDVLSALDDTRGDLLSGGSGVDRCRSDRGDRRTGCP